MQQETNVADKKATTRKTRAGKPVVDPKAEDAAKRSEAALKAAITRKVNADRRAAEAKRQADAAAKAKADAEAKRQADAKAEADRKAAEAKPEKKPFNWLWVIVPVAVLILLGCCLPGSLWLFGFRFAPAQPAPAVVLPTAVPPTVVLPTAVPPVVAQTYSFAAPGNLDDMPKTSIELAAENTWFHRVFNERLFHAPDWGGADSWFVTLNLGPNSGGNWTSMGNPGQIVYRGTSTHLQWCLGVLTTSQWKTQFMGDANIPAAINVRIGPNSNVTVVTASGKTVTQATSDMGDITVILPDSGVITITVDYITAAPTHESLVWWGPYDRSKDINTIDAR